MHTHNTLRNWRARRAGGRITVYGELPNGDQTKIVGVLTVMPGPTGSRHCVAVHKDGSEHILLVG